MKIPNSSLISPPSIGDDYPELVHGTAGPVGGSIVKLVNFKGAVIGSRYTRKVSANHVQKFLKVKDDDADGDWVLAQGIISQRLLFSQFTAAGAAGTCALNATIPAGSVFVKTLIGPVVGFTGNVSATIIVGDSPSDTDRYMTGTPSVFTTVATLDAGVPSGTVYHAAAVTPLVTITASSAYSSVTAGAVTVTLFYYGINL